jgi:hypothetical protein
MTAEVVGGEKARTSKDVREMATAQTTPPVPGWLRNTAVLVFLAIAAYGAIDENVYMIAAGGVLTVVALGIDRLRQIALWGVKAIFGGPPPPSVPVGGDFDEPDEEEPGGEGEPSETRPARRRRGS